MQMNSPETKITAVANSDLNKDQTKKGKTPHSRKETKHRAKPMMRKKEKPDGAAASRGREWGAPLGPLMYRESGLRAEAETLIRRGVRVPVWEEERPHTPLTTTVRSLLSLSALRACDSFLQSSRPVQE